MSLSERAGGSTGSFEEYEQAFEGVAFGEPAKAGVVRRGRGVFQRAKSAPSLGGCGVDDVSKSGGWVLVVAANQRDALVFEEAKAAHEERLIVSAYTPEASL